MSEKPTCRYDREVKAHMTREHLPECIDRLCKGCVPCTHDEHGNPVRHCRTRLRCTTHLGWDDHTCPTCVGKIRSNLTGLLDALAIMPMEATMRGINSEPANLAGPHADYVTSQWRLINADRNGESVEELDMLDPYTCLTMHERTIREDLGHDAETLVSPTISAAAGYLSWVLTDLARDEGQTLALMALMADVARLRAHAETALSDGRARERGAPCRSCPKPAPRLELHHGHWCEEGDCRQQHHDDDSADRWVCPTERDHWWTTADYRRWVYADARAQNA